mgnify:CR=1 FL=1
MVKTKKLFKIAIVTLSIVAVSIIILAVWISRDDYVPKKLGNSVSAALNNRYGSSCSIVENDKYIFYVNCVKDSFPLVRIDKNSGEKKLLKKILEIAMAQHYLYTKTHLSTLNQKIWDIQTGIMISIAVISMVKKKS